MASKKVKVVVVEDEAILRELLSAYCVRIFDCNVVAAVADGLQAVEAIVRNAPDMVLLDLRLPGLDGLDVVERVRSQGLFPRILILSSVCNLYTAYKIERAGIHGFLYKGATMPLSLREAMTAVSQGRNYFCPIFKSYKRARLDNPVFFDKILSAREQTVLTMVSDGMTDIEIALVLRISPRTVESHRMSILRKLGFRSKLDLERYGRSCGFTRTWQICTAAASGGT